MSSIPRPGGCVAAVDQLSADAGAEILRVGGNAVDAAVAAAFAQGVADPLRCGIGGGGVALTYRVADLRSSVRSFYGRAPRAAHETMYEPDGHWGTLFRTKERRNQFGYLASVTPGLVRGLYDCFTQEGSGLVGWASILAPAIELAEDGYLIYPHHESAYSPEGDHDFLDQGATTMTYTEAAREIFTKSDGSHYEVGDLLRQPDYAKTLRAIAEDGPDVFYTGWIAERMVSDSRRNGGLISLEDLSTYESEVQDPIHGSFHGLSLVTEGPPSMGVTFLQILGILDHLDLGFTSPAEIGYLRLLAGAMHLAFSDRRDHIGDPEFVEDVTEWLISTERAQFLAERIQSGNLDPVDGANTAHSSSETTHVTVIDRDGNAAAITHSIGSGSGVVTSGLGFMHNNHMIQFNPHPGEAASIAPGKRPNVGGAPVMVFANNDLVLAMGSPAGGWKASAMAQTMLNRFVFGMDLASAIDSDRIHVEDDRTQLSADSTIDPVVVGELSAAGFDVNLTGYGARIAAIERDPSTGWLEGASDRRGDKGVAYEQAD